MTKILGRNLGLVLGRVSNQSAYPLQIQTPLILGKTEDAIDLDLAPVYYAEGLDTHCTYICTLIIIGVFL